MADTYETLTPDQKRAMGFVISKPGLNLPDGSDPAGRHQYWCGNDLWDHRREYAAIFRSAELAKRQIDALGLTEYQYSQIRLDG